MKFLQNKTIFVQKPYLKEIQDSIHFKWIAPKRLEDLDYYAKGYFRDVRRHQAVDISKAYQYLDNVRGLLPNNCSHQWLHEYLLSLVKIDQIKLEYQAAFVRSEQELIDIKNWPGVTSDVFTKIGSTIAIPKFYGIDTPPPQGNGKYFDANLMIFATGVP